MGENCAGRHYCEPPYYPSGLGEFWTCPECGAAHRSFRVHDHIDRLRMTPRMVESIPPETHGWTTGDM